MDKAGERTGEPARLAVSESLPQNRYCTVCRSVYPNDVKFCPKDGAPLELQEQVLGGRFVLKERIGAGNMGTVHRAVQLPMGREVAVKLLHAEMALNPDMVARFEREALAASTVDHPNAITIYDSGKTDDNQVFIAMEFLEGESLAAILRREHRLLPERALELLMPAVKAMVVAHRKGVLHRDLKPDNIFVAKKVNEEGATEEVIKVLDFGIAKLLEGHRGNRMALKTVAGVRIGTAMYMAPEQLEGRPASKQSDVYALGLMLIELIVGRMPWGRGGDEGDTMLTMLRLVNPPLPLAELCKDRAFSPELQSFFNEVLAIDPAKRPADAGELLRRIGQLPEAAALTQGGAKRSEISMMMTATAMPSDSARSERNLLGGSPATTLPMVPAQLRPPMELGPDGSRDETLPRAAEHPLSPPVQAGLAAGHGADLGSDDETARHPRDQAGASGERDLAQVPTVITGSRPVRAPVAPANLGPGDSRPSPPTEPLAASPPAVPPTKLVKTLHSSNMATLPTGVAAPLVGLPGEPAPTVPMQVARMPKGLTAAARLATTLPSVGPSSTTLRAEPTRPRRRLGLALLLGAVLLAGLAYLMLRPTGRPPPTRRPPGGETQPPPALPGRPSAAVVRPPSPSTGEDAAPRVTPRPSSSSEDGGASRRRSALQVTFLRKRPTQMSIVCSSSPRACGDSCSVGPGEHCVARSPGYQPKRFSYDELKAHSSRGRARIEVKLTTAP